MAGDDQLAERLGADIMSEATVLAALGLLVELSKALSLIIGSQPPAVQQAMWERHEKRVEAFRGFFHLDAQ